MTIPLLNAIFKQWTMSNNSQTKLQGYYSVCNDDTEQHYGVGNPQLADAQLVWSTHSLQLEAV
jgi:hypothetical protein